MSVAEGVYVFFGKPNVNSLIELMKSQDQRQNPNSLLNYHIELVRLLAMCTEGKNAGTELKCHQLITLDDLVEIVTHPDCVTEVR